MRIEFSLKGYISEEEAEIVQWKFEKGQDFKKGDVLVEVLEEKTSIDVRAESDGRIIEINADEGEIVSDTDIIAVLDI